MFLTLLAVVAFSLWRNDTSKTLIVPIVSYIIALYINTKPLNYGDIKICTDTKTYRTSFIPLKDRFLHTLILGPTGSGKTSQIILPMINQDMQDINCGITVIEPKTDLAEKVYAMAQYYGRKCLYFNPQYPFCPIFNPLFGEEEIIVENMVLCFRTAMEDSSDFFKDANEQLTRNAVKVVKRVKGNKATILELERFLNNTGGVGRQYISVLEAKNNIEKSTDRKKENANLISYFLTDYFNEKSELYNNTSSLRTQLARLNGNRYMRRVLNPTNGSSSIDFTKHLEEGGVIAITTAQGILNQTLSRLLGYFLILNLQSAVFQRKGTEFTRLSHFLYIDEFQEYANKGFGVMLTQGRSYRVASHLATQNRALIAGGGDREGQAFLELVMTNCRNQILFPDLNPDDCEYFSRAFGEVTTYKSSVSRSRDSGQYIGYKSFSHSTTEEKDRRISPTDISQRPFGQITYKLMKDNTAQKASFGKVNFLPQALNGQLNQMIAENTELLAHGIQPDQYRTHEGNLKYSIQDILVQNTPQDNII